VGQLKLDRCEVTVDPFTAHTPRGPVRMQNIIAHYKGARGGRWRSPGTTTHSIMIHNIWNDALSICGQDFLTYKTIAVFNFIDLIRLLCWSQRLCRNREKYHFISYPPLAEVSRSGGGG